MEVVKVLLAQFGALIQAPADVEKLNTAVLGWAVQGRLVEQDPNDEPAAMLFERITTEKEALFKTGKIVHAPLAENQEIYHLPKGWIRVRFSEITYNRDGERIPLSKEIREGRKGEFDYYGASGVIDKIDDYLFDKPLLLIGEDGANLINRSTPIAFIAHGKYWVNNHAHVIDSLNLSVLRYLELYINATDLQPYVTGTAQPKMNQAKMNSIPVALPPIEEQERIVAKVEAVLGQTQVLARQMGEMEEKRKATRQAALRRLVTAESQTDVATAWEFIAQHFHDLYTEPEAVQELKQAILQLAVQGRLVPQDLNDEPAIVLLGQITAQKERLVKTGKISGVPIPETQELNHLPKGWILARFGEVTYNRDGERVPLSKELREGRKGEFDYYGASGVIDKIDAYLFDKPLLLIGEDGANLINRSTPIAYIAHGKYWVNNHAHVLDSLDLSVLRYLELFINAIDLKPYVTGTAQPKMNQAKMNSIPVALPPYEEQKRIVAKVNELFSLCDQLAAQLTTAQTAREQALTAILAQAV